MSWRDTMQQVLQGVMLPPQIPTNFQQPQSGIPLPPMGRFGMEAFNMAGLPSSIPRRMVTPAQLIRNLPPVAYVPPSANDAFSPDVLPPGLSTPPITHESTLDPITPPIGSQSPPTPDYSQPMDPNAAAPAYVPDAPYTYPTPPAPANPPNAVAVPPPHVPAPYTDENQMIPYAPEPAPVAPWAPVMPGSTTTEHSAILNAPEVDGRGRVIEDTIPTVGDLMGGSPQEDSPGVLDYFTNPIGSIADAVQGWQESAGPMGSPLQLVDSPMWGSGMWGYDNWGDPWLGNAPPWDSYYGDQSMNA